MKADLPVDIKVISTRARFWAIHNPNTKKFYSREVRSTKWFTNPSYAHQFHSRSEAHISRDVIQHTLGRPHLKPFEVCRVDAITHHQISHRT